MSYDNVPICDACWRKREPRQPVRFKEPLQEMCYFCGKLTRSGIYVRERVETLRDAGQGPKDRAEGV